MRIRHRVIVSLSILLCMFTMPSLSYSKALSPKAETSLGYAYYFGRGVPQDYYTAVYWWGKAAAQGYAAGESNLGDAYYNGQGVPKNYYTAVYWWGKAAAQGYAAGEYDLGYAYWHGQGVPR